MQHWYIGAWLPSDIPINFHKIRMEINAMYYPMGNKLIGVTHTPYPYVWFVICGLLTLKPNGTPQKQGTLKGREFEVFIFSQVWYIVGQTYVGRGRSNIVIIIRPIRYQFPCVLYGLLVKTSAYYARVVGSNPTRETLFFFREV